jgi:hypothetical protein
VSGTSHPFAKVVLDLFVQRPCHDRVTLATDLAVGSPAGKLRPYMTVAQDMLEHLEKAGQLVRDRYGWYRLPEETR